MSTFLLQFQQRATQAKSSTYESMKTSTMTRAREHSDDDHHYNGSALLGTKTVTATRENTDADHSAFSFHPLPRCDDAARGNV